VVLGREELIVGVDRVRLLGSLEVPLGLVDVRLLDGRPDVLQAEVVAGECGGIRLDAHGRLLPAAQADESDAGKLRDLLGQAAVGEVLHLRERQGGRRGGGRGRGGVGGGWLFGGGRGGGGPRAGRRGRVGWRACPP